MEDEKKQERSFELRSEKVRSIVGQIPSSLVRYGIMIVGVVLLCLLIVAYFLPYKQVYSGTAVVHSIVQEQKADSIETTLLLRFEMQRMKKTDIMSQPIYLQTEQGVMAGQLRQLSSIRDTLERQQALCIFLHSDLKQVENQTVDFRIVHSSSNLLQKILGRL